MKKAIEEEKGGVKIVYSRRVPVRTRGNGSLVSRTRTRRGEFGGRRLARWRKRRMLVASAKETAMVYAYLEYIIIHGVFVK